MTNSLRTAYRFMPKLNKKSRSFALDGRF